MPGSHSAVRRVLELFTFQADAKVTAVLRGDLHSETLRSAKHIAYNSLLKLQSAMRNRTCDCATSTS